MTRSTLFEGGEGRGGRKGEGRTSSHADGELRGLVVRHYDCGGPSTVWISRSQLACKRVIIRPINGDFLALFAVPNQHCIPQ
jgi:hypothetical protein